MSPLSAPLRIAIAALALAEVLVAGQDQPPAPGRAGPATRPQRPDLKRGLLRHESAAAFEGFTLFAPLNSTTTYLVDMQGRKRHTWPSRFTPGQSVYLLEDGSILRCAREPGNRNFFGGGIGGRIERISFDGKVEWEFVYADERHCQHHDIEPLPNGNVLLIAWERKSKDEAIAAGRDPKRIENDAVWPDSVIEVRPTGEKGGEIVWEWHVWDHLVQDVAKDKANYGVVADHPELVDLNYERGRPMQPRERRRLRDLGYMGGVEPDEDGDDQGPGPQSRPGPSSRPGPDGPPGGGFFPGPGGGPGRGPRGMESDWLHTNAIAYNAKLDQIALSIHSLNEIWIIDHGTTTAQAAGHAGGRWGKGGDLLYRWGNPRVHRAGTAEDQTLFSQHDVRWIPDGMPGAGHLMVFNNGEGRRDGRYSSIVEFAPPTDSQGRYRLDKGKPFGPEKPAWEYAAANKPDFFSSHISGAERLPNGDTLVCSGEQGRIFEVTRNGEIVWEYVNPYLERNGPREDFLPFGPPRGPRREGGPNSRPAGAPDDPTGNEDGPNGLRDRRSRPGESRDGGPGPDGPPRGFPGPFGGPGMRGGPGGPGGPMGGLFRASRYGLDYPGVKRVPVNPPPAEAQEPSPEKDGRERP
ncbi:MAG: aryl-sulfate sulfotransferase [Planctomycetes bacterium]|nr:aryl-sulfate sulfotransferase [Planctomycetota bacterium]